MTKDLALIIHGKAYVAWLGQVCGWCWLPASSVSCRSSDPRAPPPLPSRLHALSMEREHYLNTFEFIDKVSEGIQASMRARRVVIAGKKRTADVAKL